MNRLRLLLTAFAALIVAQGVSAASPTIARVDAGWNDVLPLNTWAPVRVEIAGGDEPASGMVTVNVRRENREVARFRRPFSATPGRTVPYEVPVRLSSTGGHYLGAQTWEIEVELSTPGGRVMDAWTSRAPSRFDAPLVDVDTAAGYASTALFVSTPSSPSFVLPSSSQAPTDPADEAEYERLLGAWFGVTLHMLDAASLPTHAKTLESVRVVVLHAQSLAPLGATRRGVLRSWVRSGGRLVVFGDATEIGTDLKPRDAVTQRDELQTDAGITLERIRWTLGLGVVELFPRQPADAVDRLTDRFDLWLRLIDQPEVQRDAWYSESPGAAAERRTLDEIVEQFAGIEPPSVGWLFLFIVLLAVLLGPFDRLVMKRLRLLHRSWASALVWIALASVGAIVVPLLATPSEPHAGTSVRIDVGPDGAAITERTVAVYATRGHRFRAGEASPGEWQHVIGDASATGGFFTPITMVGDGATLPTMAMRSRSLLGYRQVTPDARVPLSVELDRDDEGRLVLRIEGDRPFRLVSGALWTDEGVRVVAGAGASGGETSSSAERQREVRFTPFTREASTYFDRHPFDDPASDQRERAMALAVESADLAYVCLEVLFTERNAVPGAPTGARLADERLVVRMPVELPPIPAPTPSESP